MAITPQYSVVPHGIKKYGDTFFAVFKMVITVAEFNKYANNANGVPTIDPISQKDWDDFKTLVNTSEWSYTFTSPSTLGGRGLLSFQKKKKDDRGLVMFTASPNLKAGGSLMSVGNSRAVSSKFAYGLDIFGSAQSKMSFVSEQKQAVYIDPKPVALGQFQDDLAKFDPNVYDKHLKQAAVYADKHRIYEDKKEENFDFRVIYGTILDEPYLAENYFGLVREVLIDVTEILKGADQQKYTINVENKEGSTGSANYLVKKIANKFYNGLEKMFITIGKRDDYNFKDVQFKYQDPYRLSQGDKLHPDGIYALVAYHTEGVLYDPFSQEGLKGCNVVVSNFKDVSTKTRQFFSLSLHEVVYNFQKDKKKSKPVKTSGCLSPRSAIEMGDKNLRSNMLFAWRGDNLLINRKQKQSDQENDHINTRVVTTKACETRFIDTELFSKEESLVKGSQLQLTAQAGNPYRFFVRTVGYTEHCLPLAIELDEYDRSYVLTLEDFLKEEEVIKASAFGSEVNFDISNPADLPIRSVDFLGKKRFNDPNNGFVDNGNHMVLNPLEGETSESRYIFPPSMKLEDFKYLGYLTKEKILKDAKLDKDEYVYRCRQIEERNARKLPEIAHSKNLVPYLADPRGRNLILYPANLFTNSVFAKSKMVLGFEYENLFPYFHKTRSAKLELSLNSAGGGDVAEVAIDGEIVASNLKSGVYAFDIYVVDDKFTPDKIGEYNATQMKMSYLSKPTEPVVASPESPKTPMLEETVMTAKREKSTANLWHLDFDTVQAGNWKSLKYTEQTSVLVLDQPNPRELLGKFNLKDNVQLLQNEYPYEIFLKEEGDAQLLQDFRTTIYPRDISLKFSTPVATSKIHGKKTLWEVKDDSILWKLNLSELDELVGKKSPNGITVYLNDILFTSGAKSLNITLKFVPERNAFAISDEKAPPTVAYLKNYINQEISVNDFEMQPEILKLYMNFSDEFLANLINPNTKFSIINPKSQVYSANKTIKLFASSQFQGYFPKVKHESQIGTPGSTHHIFVPNNIEPEVPVLDTDILLMHSKDDDWVGDKTSTTRNLIRLTINQDFMREGKNMLGIVLYNVNNKKDLANVSLFGDDITKLSKYDFSVHTLDDFLDFDRKSPLFSKYFDENPLKNYRIGGIDYCVLHCIPYYNYEIKKWQVVLPFKVFYSAETIFVKLAMLKIALGSGLSKQGNSYVDTTGTNLSKLVVLDPLPIYTQKTFAVRRDFDSYQITYKGPDTKKRKKLFFVMLLNTSYNLSEFIAKGTINDDMASFNCSNAIVEPGSDKKVLCFSGNSVTISKPSCRGILALEFEIHSNFKGSIPSQPTFVNKNPLFNTAGIRLINVAEFDA